MKVSFEYGHGLMTADLPDSTDIFIPGETVPDPPYIPEDQIEAKTLESIRNPMGMEPLSKLAHKGSKVTIIFPDRVKGGEQPTSHRKVSIRLILQELYAAGVEKKDILLICSNGLHRKNTEQEIRGVLGDELFNEFWYTHQIINHDSEDYDHLVDLGTTDRGDPVLMNKYVYDWPYPGQPLRRLFRRLQALCNRYYSLEIHRISSCSAGYAPERLYTGKRQVSDAYKI